MHRVRPAPRKGGRWEAVPGSQPPPGPPLSCWPWVLVAGLAIQGSVVAYLASLTQVIKPAHRACPVAHLQRPPSSPSGHPSQPATAPHPSCPSTSLSFPHVFKDTRSAEFSTNLCSHPGRKGFSGTWASSPFSASVSPGPLDWLCEGSCLRQAPRRRPSGPGNSDSAGLLCSLRNSIPPTFGGYRASEASLDCTPGLLSCRCQQGSCLTGRTTRPPAPPPLPSAFTLSGHLLPEAPLLVQFLSGPRSKVGARFKEPKATRQPGVVQV